MTERNITEAEIPNASEHIRTDAPKEENAESLPSDNHPKRQLHDDPRYLGLSRVVSLGLALAMTMLLV